MPAVRDDEMQEYSFVGPFGGLQSEVAFAQIGKTGFAEVQNVIFRRGHARTVPGFTALASPSAEPIVGIADFFNVNSVRTAVLITPTKVFKRNSDGTYTQITGTLTGTSAQFFQWAVVGYKLFFSQQKDTIQFWDGVAAAFSAATNIVPAKYMMEIGLHLMIGNTIEAGPTNAPNRVHWSMVGDGTNWTDFTSGQQDIFNNLGPITGMTRLFQTGYIFQQWGITQVVPTGIGLQPFNFISMGAYAKGSILPYGLASFGELVAAYVGKDDIYVFDGTSSQPIGSNPMDGNRRLGARTRIFNDLFVALQTNIFGYILTSANGNTYESYWLFIPSLNKAWVYHFDEGNWTQVFFAPSQLLGPASTLPLAQVPRIMDLVGPISAQSWSPQSLTNANQLDTMVISDSTANSVDYFNFGATSAAPTSGSINTNDGWYIKSGPLDFDDNRHTHTVSRVRLVLEDYGVMTFNMRLTNEFGIQSSVQTLTFGTGSGGPITRIFDFGNGINGKYITYELSGPQNVNMALVEISPYYDTGGEVQGGTR